MLADTKDKGVVDDEARALWLGDVEVVSLGVGCWVASEKGIWWVLTCMEEGNCKGQCMRVVLDRVLGVELATRFSNKKPHNTHTINPLFPA